MGCGCNNNNNKKLRLDDMKNMSLDEILKLYRDGYRLDDGITSTQPSGIKNIQPSGIRNVQPSGIIIQTMQNSTITIVNPPSGIPAGQSVTFTIRYDLNVSWYGEWTKFRICYNGAEIGSSWPTLLFGHSVGNINISATFPTGINGTISINAEATINELSWTCGDPDVIAFTTVNIPVITQGTNTISLLNLPNSVKPGWAVELQVSYNIIVSNLGEWVKFRICGNGYEIGFNNELLFGNATGTVTIPTIIPTDASGTISIRAEVTTSDLSFTCGDSGVIATDGPTNVTVETPNSISIVNTPQSVASGRTVDFTINYSLSVSTIGEWVRFRICSNGTQIGTNNELLFGNSTGVIIVTAVIPPSATGTISIQAEATINELSDTCGDPDVVAIYGPVNITVIQGNTISIINPPSQVSAGENVDFTIDYNLNVDSLGEWVKFRICDGTGVQISSKISLLFGNAVGNVTINTQIPPSSSNSISLKAEVTINELSSTCGDSDVIALMAPVDIPVVGSVNSLVITNMPTSVSAGQEIIFTLDYNLSSISLPEIVRFRTCIDGLEIGSNVETLYNAIGSTTITTVIPSNATNSISLKAEVTIDEFNSICGDIDVVAKTSEISIPIYGTVLPTASHYIEYDIGFLPTWFLDLVVENVQWISDTLGPYLPLGNDLQYISSEYVSGKFRIYVKYLPTLSSPIYMAGLGLPNDMLDLNVTYYYNSSTGKVETIAIPSTLPLAAGLIAGIIIFVLLARITKANPYGIIASAVVGIIGAALITFSIVELSTMLTTTGETPPVTPQQKIETIKNYYNEYLKVACEELYADCVTDPVQCDVGMMRAYIGCIGGEKYAQCMHARAAAGDTTETCENIKTQIMQIDACLASEPPTCTVDEAKAMLDTVIADVDAVVEEKLTQVTCPTDQTYDPDKKSCVPNEQCAIRNPFGGCILSQGAASGIIMIGAALVGAYVLMKASPSVRSSRRTFMPV